MPQRAQRGLPAAVAHRAACPQEYDRAKVQLVKHERLLLKEFGFVTMVEHPHKFVFNLIEMVAKLGGEQILPGHPCHPLLQEAWNLLNDRCGGPRLVLLPSNNPQPSAAIDCCVGCCLRCPAGRGVLRA